MILNLGIIDFGIGNLRSLLQILKILPIKFNIYILNKIYQFNNIDKLILPGQGSCSSCLNYLKNFDLLDSLIEFSKLKSILGICVNKHIFFQKTEEGYIDVLNLFPGFVSKFDFIKIPHLGWNKVFIMKDHYIFNNIKNYSYFYFAHSYYVLPSFSENIFGITKYKYNFSSIYIKDNIILTQFHPEKSFKSGLILMYNFCLWGL